MIVQEKANIVEYLKWIVQNIDEFEFRTGPAIRLRDDLRKWYYGRQDPLRTFELARRFNTMFSGNMILDQIAQPIWQIVDQCPVEKDPQILQQLSVIPRGHIVGKSILSYGGVAGEWRDEKMLDKRIRAKVEDADKSIQSSSQALDALLEQEKEWYRQNGMSLEAGIVALTALAALAVWLVTIVQIAKWFLMGGSWSLFSTGEMIFLAGGVAAVVYLLTQLPKLLMTMSAGFLWVFYQKWQFARRKNAIQKIRDLATKDRLTAYGDSLLAAARDLALHPDCLRKEDPTRTYLGTEGSSKVLPGYRFVKQRPTYGVQAFCRRLEKKRLRSRKVTLFLSFALILIALLLRVI